jgi:ABC-2 type transport system ATP-binding protein
MRVVTGYLPPTGGTARVSGKDIQSHPVAAKREIGFLPEGAPLYGDMSVIGFLQFIARLRRLTGEVRKRRMADVIERMGLGEVLYQPIETLSKGYKRRVGMAQAILHDPDVLILDEPTDGLDPNQKHEVRALIRGMSAEKVIVLSTHILEEVDAVCTRATIIADGRIVSDGTPEELLRRSRMHNALKLGLAVTDPSGVVESLQAIPDVSHAEVTSQSDGAVELLLLPAGSGSLAGPVSAAAHANGWHVTEMHVERGRLDDVFRAITTGERGTSNG